MNAMKSRYPRADAIAVARELCSALSPACEKLIVGGSLRRRKQEVGDVEIIYIPATQTVKSRDLFATDTKVNLVDVAIADLERRYVLGRRRNANGSEVFGAKNKLMIHKLSGIPVDLFSARPGNWWNTVVCRTGGAENNRQIAIRAGDLGYQWNPYGAGFTRLEDGAIFPMKSERAVFDFLGLLYLEPWDRQ